MFPCGYGLQRLKLAFHLPAHVAKSYLSPPLQITPGELQRDAGRALILLCVSLARRVHPRQNTIPRNQSCVSLGSSFRLHSLLASTPPHLSVALVF